MLNDPYEEDLPILAKLVIVCATHMLCAPVVIGRKLAEHGRRLRDRAKRWAAAIDPIDFHAM